MTDIASGRINDRLRRPNGLTINYGRVLSECYRCQERVQGHTKREASQWPTSRWPSVRPLRKPKTLFYKIGNIFRRVTNECQDKTNLITLMRDKCHLDAAPHALCMRNSQRL